MGSSSRSTEFTKVYKVLKKAYEPVAQPADRTVLENLIFACCLEDSHYPAAEEAFAALIHTFFDYNEIRVTSIAELSEVMANLSDPPAAANRVKRVLQAVFEESYSFDLEPYRKKNLGPTVKWLKGVDGTSGFVVSYVVQAALGGHSIPLDIGALRALNIAEVVTDKEIDTGSVTGLERAIPKSKGVEFGSLLHQLGADFTANPYSPALHKIILEINPDAKDRLPKRRRAKPKKAEAPAKKVKKKAPAKKADGKRKAAAPTKAAGRKKTPAVKKKKAATKAASAATKKKKAATRRISKRKPR